MTELGTPEVAGTASGSTAGSTERSTAGSTAGRRGVVMVFVGVQLGMILSTIDGTILANALPAITRDLGHADSRSWVLTVYMLASVAVTPIYGKLGDLYGRKRMYLIAVSLFSLGSMLSGIAGTFGQLVYFRGLQGLGAGGIGPLAMGVVADIVPARQIGRWLGYQGMLFAVASLAGPLTGGLFVDHLSWRWAFCVNLPLAVVSMVIVATRLHVPYERISHAIDYLGSALLTGALTLVVLGAALGGNTLPWISPATALIIVAVVVLARLFVARERRAAEPVLPLRVFASPVVGYASALNVTSGALFSAGLYFIPVFLQQVRGWSATGSGLLLVPFMFVTAFTTMIAGRSVERSGRYRRWPIVGSACAIVAVGALSTLTGATTAAAAAVMGAVLGAGIGFIMQTSLLAVQNAAAADDTGVATSTALLCRALGSTLGVALCSAALTGRLPSGHLGPAAYAHAIPAVYWAALPIAAAQIVLAIRLPELTLRAHARYEL